MPRRRKTAAEEEGAQPENGDALFGGPVPYMIGFRVRGTRPYLFHRPDLAAWDPKPEKADRPDRPDYEKLVWRDDGGGLVFPSHQFLKAIMTAARGYKDPTKSGHKSMRPIIPTAMQPDPEFCPMERQNGAGPEQLRTWDVIDERIVRLANVMGPGRRPKIDAGWETSFWLNVVWPAIFTPASVTKFVGVAGLVGVGDGLGIGFGRFVVVEVLAPREISWT